MSHHLLVSYAVKIKGISDSIYKTKALKFSHPLCKTLGTLIQKVWDHRVFGLVISEMLMVLMKHFIK